jgi:hypothetical protein
LRLGEKIAYIHNHCDVLKPSLTAIANGHPQTHIDDLLPWNFKLST